MLLDDVVVVEQPVRCGADVERLDVGLVELAIGLVEDPPCLDEARKEPGGLVPGLVMPLPRRKGPGAGREVLGAQQFAAQGAGNEVLEGGAGTKTGEDRTGDAGRTRKRR